MRKHASFKVKLVYWEKTWRNDLFLLAKIFSCKSAPKLFQTTSKNIKTAYIPQTNKLRFNCRTWTAKSSSLEIIIFTSLRVNKMKHCDYQRFAGSTQSAWKIFLGWISCPKRRYPATEWPLKCERGENKLCLWQRKPTCFTHTQNARNTKKFCFLCPNSIPK